MGVLVRIAAAAATVFTNSTTSQRERSSSVASNAGIGVPPIPCVIHQ